MSWLVDTDWGADYLKGRPAAMSLLTSFANEGLAISIITFGEIYEGIYYGRDVHVHEQGFRRFLRWVPILPLNQAVMRRFARIRGDLRRKGELIGDPDLLIAATALHHDLAMVTRNTRHFARIAELKLYQPN